MEEITKSKAVKPIKNKPEITDVEILPGRIVKLFWCDAVGAEKYIIRRYTTVDGERVPEKLETLTNEFTSFRDTTIPDDGTYEYRITATKKVSKSETAKKHSAFVSVSIISLDPPTLPRISTEGNGIKISWDNNDDVYGYVVLRRFSFMKRAAPIAVLTNGETEYTDKKFAKGQLIYYSIQTIVQNGDSTQYSKPSNELCSVILPVPKVLKKKKKLGKKLLLSVRLCAGADGYILFRRASTDEDPVEVFRTDSISSFDLIDATPKPAKELLYSVACFKKTDKEEFIGRPCEEIMVKI